MKKIIISLICIFLLSGCFNYNELNDYAIVEAITIDYDNQKYSISMLIANNSKDKEKANIIFQAKGKNIYEALKNIELISTHKLYLGHISVVIISENSAKKGLYDIITPFLTNNQINKDFYIILAKNTKASKLLKTSTPITDFPSQYITNNIKASNKSLGSIKAMTFNELIKQLINSNNPTINGYTLENKYIKASTLGYFKEDKFINWTTKNESTGINLINNQVQELYLDLPCPNGNIIISTNNAQSTLKIDKQGNTKIIINSEASIKELTCNINIKSEDNIKEIEKEANKAIKNYINKAITLSKHKKIDLFGIQKLYYQNYPKQYKNIHNWNNYYVKLKITSQVNIKIKDNGTLKQSIERISHEKNY